MNMSVRNIFFSLFILSQTFLVVHDAEAGKVYRWTDEEGIVHYSDVPPVDAEVTGTQEINLDVYDENIIDPDRYSIINQVDRMAERRRQDTEERLAIKRLQLEEKRLANELQTSQLNEIINAQDYGSRSFYYSPYPQYYSYPYQQHLYTRDEHKRRHQQREYPHRSRFTHRAGIILDGPQSKGRYIKFGSRFSSRAGFHR